MLDLTLLRKSLTLRRKQLTHIEITEAAFAVSQHFCHEKSFVNAKNIAGYFAVNGEVDANLIAEKIRERAHNYYLPILHPARYSRLWFAKYDNASTLAPNRLQIPEPNWQSENLIAPWELDIVLTPLVAFDARGNRLGMGGGFYDRTFAFLNNRKREFPKLIGLAYDWQEVPALPKQSWDVALDAVITPTKIHFCSPGETRG